MIGETNIYKPSFESYLQVWLDGSDLLDHSMNHYTVTQVGTITANNIQTINGISVPCLYRTNANSTTNKLTIGNSQVPISTWDQISFGAWIKPAASGQWACYAALAPNTTSNLLEIRQYSNTAYYGVVSRNSGTTDDMTCNNTMPLNVNNWTFFYIVQDGLFLRVYYNGINKFCRFNVTNPLTGANMVHICGGVFSADNTQAHYLTDFRVYNYALSSADIMAMYKAGPQQHR